MYLQKQVSMRYLLAIEWPDLQKAHVLNGVTYLKNVMMRGQISHSPWSIFTIFTWSRCIWWFVTAENPWIGWKAQDADEWWCSFGYPSKSCGLWGPRFYMPKSGAVVDVSWWSCVEMGWRYNFQKRTTKLHPNAATGHCSFPDITEVFIYEKCNFDTDLSQMSGQFRSVSRVLVDDKDRDLMTQMSTWNLPWLLCFSTRR